MGSWGQAPRRSAGRGSLRGSPLRKRSGKTWYQTASATQAGGPARRPAGASPRVAARSQRPIPTRPASPRHLVIAVLRTCAGAYGLGGERVKEHGRARERRGGGRDAGREGKAGPPGAGGHGPPKKVNVRPRAPPRPFWGGGEPSTSPPAPP